jgi:hypothetical protein
MVCHLYCVMNSISISKELSPTRLHHDTAHKTTFCTISAVKILKLVYVKVVSLPNDMYSLGANTYGWNSTVSEWTTWHSRCLNLCEVVLHRRIVKILLYILGYPLRFWYRRFFALTRFFVALLIPSTELLGNIKSLQVHFIPNSLFRHHSIVRLCVVLLLESIASKWRMPNKFHVKTRRYPLVRKFQRPSAFFCWPVLIIDLVTLRSLFRFDIL